MLVSVGFTASLVLTGASPAFAQAAAGRAGGTGGNGGGRDRLDLSVSASQALDSELPSEALPAVPGGGLQAGGPSTLLFTSADFAHNRRAVQVTGAAFASFKQSSELDRIAALGHSAAMAVGVRLPAQGRFDFSQSAAYAPSYLYQLFPSAAPVTALEPIPTGIDYRIDEAESYSYTTKVAASFGSPRGTRLTGSTEYHLSDFHGETRERPDLTSYTHSVKAARALSRRGGASIEYQYRRGEFGSGGPTSEHRFTMGVEYTPALSATRRLALRLNVSPSIVALAEGTIATPSASSSVPRQRQYPLQWDASVDYPFRLKWRATVSYRQALSYVAVVSEPLYSRGAQSEVIGRIGRRLDLSATAGYATAVSAVVGGGRSLGTYTGDARVGFALTSTFSLYSEYLYFRYDLGDQGRLVQGLPNLYEKHGVRAGFILTVRPFGK